MNRLSPFSRSPGLGISIPTGAAQRRSGCIRKTCLGTLCARIRQFVQLCLRAIGTKNVRAFYAARLTKRATVEPLDSVDAKYAGQ